MFEYQRGNLPIKVWLTEQEYYGDAELCKQAEAVARHPNAFHHVSLMPDAHAGYGLMIGGVVAFKDAICPYGVGMDVSCGVCAVETNLSSQFLSRDILEKLKERIKQVIPMGFTHHKDRYHIDGVPLKLAIPTLPIPEGVKDIATIGEIICSCGSLGGGNHFLELQEDERGITWLMLHSGSRNLGATVCKKFHRIATEYCKDYKVPIPNVELATLPIPGPGEVYRDAMNYCMAFAHDNRELMMYRLLGVVAEFFPGVKALDKVHVNHNYASLEEHFGEKVWVHRKGATVAAAGSFGAIPGSMSQKSYIVRGLGDSESFESCSHGAGRAMSRGQAKRTLSMEVFRNDMKDIVSSEVDPEHLDESGRAYKDVNVVMRNQKNLVEIAHTLSPRLNLKA